MSRIIAAAAALALTVAGLFRTTETPDSCLQDSYCEYSCCDYTGEKFVTPGVCKEIAEVPRCEDRKHNYRIILLCLLILLASIIFVLAFMKRKEVTMAKQLVDSIKTTAFHEENLRKTRKAQQESLASPDLKGTHRRQFTT